MRMELTATGIVTDSHRIPFSPLVTLGYKICNTRFLKLVTLDSKLVTLGAHTYNTRSVKAPCALQM